MKDEFGYFFIDNLPGMGLRYDVTSKTRGITIISNLLLENMINKREAIYHIFEFNKVSDLEDGTLKFIFKNNNKEAISVVEEMKLLLNYSKIN